MSQEIHEHFLHVSATVSSALNDAIARVGMIELTPRRDLALPEQLCRAVAGQQLSTKAAETIWGRIIDATAGKPLLPFILNSEPDVLRSCGLSNAKTKAIYAIADAFISQKMTESALAKMSAEERSKVLTSIWGVGPWTVDMVNMFYFCEADIWPGKDLAVSRGLQSLTSDDADINAIAERFKPYRSYLAFYMWCYKNLN